MQMIRLNINNYEPSIGLLIKLLHILSNISSLRISPFPMDLSKTVCPKGTKDFDFVSNNNNIAKICLGKMNELEVYHFFYSSSPFHNLFFIFHVLFFGMIIILRD